MATVVTLVDGPLAGERLLPVVDLPAVVQLGANGTAARYRLVGFWNDRPQYRLERALSFAEGG